LFRISRVKTNSMEVFKNCILRLGQVTKQNAKAMVKVNWLMI
jgi:hypothetical protein